MIAVHFGSQDLGQVQIGNPVHHLGLLVFPLFHTSAKTIPYCLSHEAIAERTITVQEISEDGSVPELLVNNQGDVRVFFLEGEELIGAKQNRILNTSVLVPARTQLRIPVSCVEQNRWKYSSYHFESSRSSIPSQLRYSLKKSVSESVRQESCYRSDQPRVWKEITQFCSKQGIHSPTSAISGVYASKQHQIDSLADQFPYVERATGLVIATRSKILTVDLFDKPSTCQKLWHRLIRGQVLCATEHANLPDSVSTEQVQSFLEQMVQSNWKQSPPNAVIGEGDEYRTESTSGHLGSVLAYDRAVVHASLMFEFHGDVPHENGDS